MKKGTKVFSLLCTVFMLLTSIVPVNATSFEFYDENYPVSELKLETISGRNDDITVPVVVKTVPLSLYTAYAANGGCEYEQTSTYYIPATEDGENYNEEFVQKVRSASPGTVSDTMLDKNRYVSVTITIRYTVYPSLDNTYEDYMVEMNSVAITRDKNPEPSSSGYFVGIGAGPNARIVQSGLSEYSPYHAIQEINQLLEWGPRGYSIPRDWVPIITTKYGPYLYQCFVSIDVTFIYKDATNGTYSVPNNFSASVNK